ncbi:MAG TPA: hypothetical protein VFY71_02640 [Planctomycetota bacterium]|nr:hypothetical protein [Planctomycetota bacterium]
MSKIVLLVLAATALVFAPSAAGQAQTLLLQDFESGDLAGWTWDNSVGLGNGLWHLTTLSSCGAVTAMAAYNSGACSYSTGETGNEGWLISPPVTLVGQAPFWISFDYELAVDGGEATCVGIRQAGTGDWIDLACSGFDPSGTYSQGLVAIDATWSGESVQIRFKFVADGSADNLAGWLVDNIRVENSSAWVDLGGALVGANGLPHLTGSGTLSGLPPNQLSLAGAKPSAPAMLFFGLSQLGAPFKGGVLVPSPLLAFPVATDAQGKVAFPLVFPPGFPAGTALYFQFWILDAAAIHGVSASNGLVGVTA